VKLKVDIMCLLNENRCVEYQSHLCPVVFGVEDFSLVVFGGHEFSRKIRGYQRKKGLRHQKYSQRNRIGHDV